MSATASTSDLFTIRVKCTSYYGTQTIIIYCSDVEECKKTMKFYELNGYVCWGMMDD